VSDNAGRQNIVQVRSETNREIRLSSLLLQLKSQPTFYYYCHCSPIELRFLFLIIHQTPCNFNFYDFSIHSFSIPSMWLYKGRKSFKDLMILGMARCWIKWVLRKQNTKKQATITYAINKANSLFIFRQDNYSTQLYILGQFEFLLL
jgi:hypothetical protein